MRFPPCKWAVPDALLLRIRNTFVSKLNYLLEVFARSCPLLKVSILWSGCAGQTHSDSVWPSVLWALQLASATATMLFLLFDTGIRDLLPNEMRDVSNFVCSKMQQAAKAFQGVYLNVSAVQHCLSFGHPS